MSDLFTADFLGTLPPALAADPKTLALGAVMAARLHATALEVPNATLYARLDTLDEDVLDLLAVDFHADWYDTAAPVAVKRQLLRESVKMHQRLGTKWAVEHLAAAYFGGGQVLEWFEYGGKPAYFKIVVEDLDTSGISMGRFAALLDKVKRKSAWLETVEFVYQVAVGMAFRGIVAECRTAVSLFGLEILYYDGAVTFDGARKFGTYFTRGVRVPALAAKARHWVGPERRLEGRAGVSATLESTFLVPALSAWFGLNVFGLRLQRFEGATRFDGAQAFSTEFERGPQALWCGAGFARSAAPAPTVESWGGIRRVLHIGTALSGAGLRAGLNVFGLRFQRFDGGTCFGGSQTFSTEFARGPQGWLCGAEYAQCAAPDLVAAGWIGVRLGGFMGCAQAGWNRVAAPVSPALRPCLGTECRAELHVEGSATAETSTMRQMGGAATFDGVRRWNADIIRYEI